MNKRDKEFLILRNSDGLGLGHGQSHMRRIGNVSYEFDYSEDGLGLCYGQPTKTNKGEPKTNKKQLNEDDPRRDLSKLDTTRPHIKYEYRQLEDRMEMDFVTIQRKWSGLLLQWIIFQNKHYRLKPMEYKLKHHFQRRSHYYNIDGPVSKELGDWHNIDNNRILWDYTTKQPKVVETTDPNKETVTVEDSRSFGYPVANNANNTIQYSQHIITWFDTVQREELAKIGQTTTSKGDINPNPNSPIPGSPTFGSGDSTNTTIISTQIITTSQIVNVSNFSIKLIAIAPNPNFDIIVQILSSYFLNKGVPVSLEINPYSGFPLDVNNNTITYKSAIIYNNYKENTKKTITTTSWSSDWKP